jgi:hypothetical protein
MHVGSQQGWESAGQTLAQVLVVGSYRFLLSWFVAERGEAKADTQPA